MHRTVRRERGANLIEAALVIPLLLLLAVCVIDLGRVYFAYITIIDVAREGARYGASNFTTTDADIQAVALAEASGQPLVSLTPANVHVDNSGVEGSFVRVEVRIDNYPLLLGGILGFSPVRLSHEVAFRIRCEVDTGC